jgi:hypothetical protein
MASSYHTSHLYCIHASATCWRMDDRDCTVRPRSTCSRLSDNLTFKSRWVLGIDVLR